MFALRLALILISAISFFAYGAACFLSDYMRREFVRYRLARQRVLVALLQWAGALGLLIGLEVPLIGRAAAFSLTAMMLLAVGVRIRIGDPFRQTSQALIFLLLNGWLFWKAF